MEVAGKPQTTECRYSLYSLFHVDVGFYVIAFPWMQESTTSVWFDHSSIPQRRYRREGDFAQQGWAGASQQRALGSDRHRASQTAAINSLTVYAAKALRAGKRDGSLRGERCREVSPFVVVAPPVKHKAGEGGGSERAGRSRSLL